MGALFSTKILQAGAVKGLIGQALLKLVRLCWSGFAPKQCKSDGERERERESYSLHEQPIWCIPPTFWGQLAFPIRSLSLPWRHNNYCLFCLGLIFSLAAQKPQLLCLVLILSVVCVYAFFGFFLYGALCPRSC